MLAIAVDYLKSEHLYVLRRVLLFLLETRHVMKISLLHICLFFKLSDIELVHGISSCCVVHDALH